MSLALLQNISSIAPRMKTPFAGTGGTAPYSYAVLGGGAGGTIDPVTGLYVAPATTGTDTVQVTDSLAATAQASIKIRTALELFCDVIQTDMDLDDGQVYLWDQKIDIPTDSRLYIAIAVMSCKPFGNSNRPDSSGSGLDAEQFASFMATLSVDILSRGPEARDRKEEVILALKSNYAQSQQEANSFYIAPLSTAFTNLSEVDGAAIPYRFNISVNLQYAVKKSQAISYYDDFADVAVVTDP